MQKDLTLEIKANTKEALKQIENLKKEIKQFSSNVKNSNTTLSQHEHSLSKLTGTIKSLAVAYGGFELAKGVVTTIADFESSIKRLGAVSKASKEDLDAMQAKARELGASTQYSASQVAEAMNYEAMAGMKTNEILSATGDILDLATVGNLDLGKASDIATDSMTAFGIKADELNKVTDTMATTITNSNTNVEQLGEAFKQVAPLAHSLKLSIGETSAMLGVLANAGLKGGIAGTHLKIILQRLASTTKPVLKGFKALGISAYDSNGKLKPLGNTLKAIKAKLKGLNDQQRAEVLKNLFGSEAISSAHILLDNLKGVDDLTKKIAVSNGEASRIAVEINSSLSGAYKELKSSLEELALSLGDDLLPVLKSFVEGMTEGVRGATEFYKENKVLIKTITELVAVFYGLSKVRAILTAVLGASALANITSLASGMGALKTSVMSLRTAMLSMASVNPVFATLAITIGAVTYAFNEWQDEIDKTNKSTETMNSIASSTKTLMKELESHFDRTTKSLTLTSDEQKRYTKQMDALIKKKKAFLKTLDPQKQKNEIDVTKNGIRVLGIWKKKIQEATIAKKKQSDATDKATQSTKQATEAEIKAAKKAEELRKKELNHIKSKYTQRVKNHENSLNRLYAKEKSIKDKIVALNEALKNKLKSLDNERLHSKEELASKIHNLEMVGASDVEKYRDKQLQAEKILSKAKSALKRGELAEYKRYKGQYENLVSSIANTEIKKDKQVLVSKKESANYGINALKKLGSLEDSYYAKSKAKAIAQHNQKMQQLKAQLTATKAQIQLEVQRLKLEKQLIEAVTGKKVDIDTSEAEKSIKAIDKSIATLEKNIKRGKKVDVDNSEAIQKIEAVNQKYAYMKFKGKVIRVDAETTPADLGISQLITKVEGDHVTMTVNPEYDEAEHQIKQAMERVEKKPVVAKVKADTKSAKSSVEKYKNNAKKSVTSQLKADVKSAKSAINRLRSSAKKPIGMSVKINASSAFATIRKLQRNTSSTHTIYVKEVHTRATGGKIPLKLATGGNTDFERKQGRINGYDPTDSDDVPALLTRGEFVIKRDAVSHYGDDFLYALNNKKLPKFATGGLVDIGKPERLIETLGRNSSVEKKEIDRSFIDEYDVSFEKAEYDKSRFDEIKASVDEIKKDKIFMKFFKKDLSTIVQAIESEKKEVKKLETGNTYTENTLLKSSLKNLIKEAKRSSNPKNYENKLQSASKLVKFNEEKNRELAQKIDEDTDKNANKINAIKEKFERYKSEVVNVKEETKSFLQENGIDNNEIIGKRYEKSFDLKKLKAYYNKIRSVHVARASQISESSNQIIKSLVPSESAITNDYKRAVDSTIRFITKYPNQARNILRVGSRVKEVSLKDIGVEHVSLSANQDSVNFDDASSAAPKIAGVLFEKNRGKIAQSISAKFKTPKNEVLNFIDDKEIDSSEAEEMRRNILQAKLPRFQAGGAINGLNGGKLNGYGGGDRNLALLEDGEFIIRKEAVSHFGSDMLERLNSMQVTLPKFQTGGLFGSGVPTSSSKNLDEMSINFQMPSGNDYKMQSSVNVAKEFAKELKRML